MTAALPDRWITDWDRFERLPFYTRANAGEVLPDPASPLGWTLVFEKGLLPGWLRGLVDFGIYREGELPLDRPPVVGSVRRLLLHQPLALPGHGGADGHDGRGVRRRAARQRRHRAALPAAPRRRVRRVLGQGRRDDRPRSLAATPTPQIDADLERVLARRRDRPDLATLSDAELVAHARSFLPELDNAFAVHDYSTLGSAVGPAMLAEACAAAGRPDALLELISGLGEVPSASPSWGLWRLSRLVNADRSCVRCSTAACRR